MCEEEDNQCIDCGVLLLDKISYVESGEYVAYNNEKGGVIERLKEDGIVDLDTEFQSVPEWISMKAMVSSWLADAIKYELWVGTDGTAAQTIYCSDLPWPIGKVLFLKQVYNVKQQLGITKDNAEEIEEQIYKRASIVFGALSSRLGDQMFLYENRPSSLDAVFLSQALITLQALPNGFPEPLCCAADGISCKVLRPSKLPKSDSDADSVMSTFKDIEEIWVNSACPKFS